MLALALYAEPALACGQCGASLTAQSGFVRSRLQSAAADDSVHAFVAAEAAGGCAAEVCRAAGDQCVSHRCCCGHCLACSGGVVAPASMELAAPPVSSDRLAMAYAPAIAGVTRSPEERPPRLI